MSDEVQPSVEPHGSAPPSGSVDEVRAEEIPTMAMPADVRSIALTALTTIAVIWVLYVGQTLIVPLLVAVVISLVLGPVVNGLHRVRVPRSLGAALVLVLFCGTFGGTVYWLTEPATALVNDMPRVAQRVSAMMTRTTGGRTGAVADLQQAADELTRATDAPARDRTGAQPVRIVEPPARLRDFVMTGSLMAGQILLVAFLVFFLLASGDLYKRKIVKLTGSSLSNKKISVQIVDEINDQLGVYLRTLALVCTLVGVATWLTYAWIGVPNAAAWGLLAAVANVVPYVGPTAVGIAASAVAMVHFDSVNMGLLVGGAQVVISSLEGFLLTPMLMSRSARMNPVAMFVGLLFWGWLWGMWGMVLAVPLLMAAKAVADRVEDFHAVGELLGE